MLYWFAPSLTEKWGPFRLLGSHLMLLAVGTLAAGFIIWRVFPFFWAYMPQDRGKKLAADGGLTSINKPTGTGMLMSLLVLPVIVLCVPLTLAEYGVLACLYLCMMFGYLDDKSTLPWSETKKGLLDLAVATVAAAFIYAIQGGGVWMPFLKGEVILPLWLYVPVAAAILFILINVTNCSDGVDGLAGTLTLVSLFALVALLYGVVGYRPVADYLRIPHNPLGARWAILTAIYAGALAGYLWHNAEPSNALMGDAGSRLFGMLVGTAVLVSGNPFLIFVVSPVVLVNGGLGLFKLVFLRGLRRAGLDVRPTHTLDAREVAGQNVIIRALHSVRFPLHDHFRHCPRYRWSNAQILMRFTLIQAFLTPILFVILIKIR
ncbi:MAG: phospho-N-acetylmuramoyl-pentapeptide-transferase [Kiritimatiellaeota bacterium]|nr:phospho-N-acetylmuramoyl-pentapeptide-transferase [Kiritimatiellota bacterium]